MLLKEHIYTPKWCAMTRQRGIACCLEGSMWATAGDSPANFRRMSLWLGRTWNSLVVHLLFVGLRLVGASGM